jgi:hypothetical protein
VDGGDDVWPASLASLPVLFFPVPVFILLVGDVFILQVTGFFTHIRLGATLVADYGDTYKSDLLHGRRDDSGREAERHKCRCV